MNISFTADNFYINGKKLEDILTITEDKKMYTIDTDIINGYDNGQQITEEAHKMLLDKGCPEDWFEEIEPEFEVGDWIYLNKKYNGAAHNKGDIVRISDIVGYKYITNKIYDKFGRSGWIRKAHFRHATIEEIKDHLTEEANKRGLIDNKYESLHNNGVEVKGSIDEVSYKKESDKLWIGTTGVFKGVAYYKGNWAEPIDTTPDIEINGYKAEFHDDYVQFGCAKIDKLFFTEIAEGNGDGWHKTGRGNRKIESIKIGKGEFTLDQIKQIAKYYQ